MYPSRNLIKYLTREQTTRFFRGIKDSRERALFACIYHYGLRVSEACLLQLADVDFEHRRIMIHRVKHGIGGERPLMVNTADLICAYLPVRLSTSAALFTGRQGGLKRQRIQQLFRVYADAAGLERSFTVHCLRHSIATHLLEAGQDIEYVRDHLGHVNIQSTIIYAQITNGKREKVFRQLERSSEIVKV